MTMVTLEVIKASGRKGKMTNLQNHGTGRVNLEFSIPPHARIKNLDLRVISIEEDLINYGGLLKNYFHYLKEKTQGQ